MVGSELTANGSFIHVCPRLVYSSSALKVIGSSNVGKDSRLETVVNIPSVTAVFIWSTLGPTNVLRSRYAASAVVH